MDASEDIRAGDRPDQTAVFHDRYEALGVFHDDAADLVDRRVGVDRIEIRCHVIPNRNLTKPVMFRPLNDDS